MPVNGFIGFPLPDITGMGLACICSPKFDWVFTENIKVVISKTENTIDESW